MKFFTALAMILVIGIAAFAADVDGKWSGSVSTPNGDLPVAFTFKADGDKLTGSTTGFDGMEVAIKDGKIDGKNISYTVAFDFGGMPFVITYKGVVSPEEIKVTADAAGMPIEFVLKKAK
jgi:hypothetical protein